MNKIILSPEEGEELKRLYRAHTEAVVAAGRILSRHGIDSKEFLEADQKAGRLWVRIRELLGKTGQHWME